MLCFRKLSVTKNFMDQRGLSGFSIENLLSHSTEKLRRGSPNETVISGCENFVLKRVMSRFSVECCCLAVPKNLLGTLLSCVSKIFSHEKVS